MFQDETNRFVSATNHPDITWNTYKKNPTHWFINHPTVQAGSNFVSSNNEVSPKQRGLMLKRGQALYVAASGATALTNGFYCNVQGGFY